MLTVPGMVCGEILITERVHKIIKIRFSKEESRVPKGDN